ncbi:MAG: hypothetical protein SFT92_05345 [Rickettsiales bacterium]|nr:hypothetical protein [Rickettsiales bacterium]
MIDYWTSILFESVWAESVIGSIVNALVFIAYAFNVNIASPFGSDTTFWALKAFGHPLLIPAIIATLGSTLGHAFNIWLGHLLCQARSKVDMHLSEESYSTWQARYKNYGVFLLLFSWLPLFGLYSFAAGFFGLRYKATLPLILIGQALYFTYHLYT